MKIAVVGSGAIGNLVAGYLRQAAEDVVLLGRPEAVAAIRETGLCISGVRGTVRVNLEAVESLAQPPDVAVLATKTQDLPAALRQHGEVLRSATIVTTQNGLQAEGIVASHLPQASIVSSIVLFGATYLPPAEVVHNFEGAWVLGIFRERPGGVGIAQLQSSFSKAFSVLPAANLRGMKYLKVFVNANNCIPAILGVSMQEAFADQRICALSVGIWKEGLAAATAAGIQLESLPGFPVENVTRLAALPTSAAAGIFCGIMTNLSREPLYGSILQSIRRKRLSEIDYLNGELVSLAQRSGVAAPLNEKLVEMVHAVERNGLYFSKEQLLNATEGLVPAS